MSTSSQPAHHTTPTSLAGGTSTPSKISSASAQTSAGIALTMSWQLLGIIVLPIVGGHFLDAHYHTNSTWMIIGMAIGLVGTIVVVRSAMQQLNEVMGVSDEDKSKEGKK